MAVAERITHILDTPYYKNGRRTNKKDFIDQQVEILQQELDSRAILLIIFPVQEVRIVGELIEDIAENQIKFIDEDNQFLLIKFPTATISAFTKSLFFELQKTGVTPIIVHPECNHTILTDLNKLMSLVEKAALSQLTSRSYVESFDEKIQKFSN